MRIVFIGAVEFSHTTLKKLVELRAEIVGVCTLENSKFNSDHVDLSPLCREHNIDCIYATDINSPENINWIKNKKPDVIFCFGWSKLLGKEILNIAPLGVVGYHPAALPENRGRHPLIWALALGLKQTASTFFFMDAGADSGDILSQKTIDIEPQDNATSLYTKMTDTALLQLEEFLPTLISGKFARQPQNHEIANVWRKRSKKDGVIDWRMSAGSIHNLVRALTKPYVGASFTYQNQEITVWKSEIIYGTPENVEYGKILEVAASGVVVKCGENSIKLLETTPAFHPKKGEYL
ncbi:MAG: formyltransferase family protein [Rickettsiales bacterium]